MVTEDSHIQQAARHVKTKFDLHKLIHDLSHYLPSQSALKDFIHHNTLHAFQYMKFYDAIRNASKIFGYKVSLSLAEYRELYSKGKIREDILDKVIAQQKGSNAVKEWKEKLLNKEFDSSVNARVGRLRRNWRNNVGIDMDTRVHPVLFRVLCGYLDQGISMWEFPISEEGFFASVKKLEATSYSGFFNTQKAKDLFLNGNYSIESLLKKIVGDEKLFTQYIFDQQFAHQGWAGIVSSLKQNPSGLLDQRKICLEEVIMFELLLEIDALYDEFGEDWVPLCESVDCHETDLFAFVPADEMSEVITLWQNSFEWTYYDQVLAGLTKLERQKTVKAKLSFQAMFCIDERECSLRRHIENVDRDCETFGTPGFFAVEFYFRPFGAKFNDKLCPAPVTPKYLIKELDNDHKRDHELLYTKMAHTALPGFAFSLSMGFVAGLKIAENLFRPKMSPAISNAFTLMNPHAELTVENKDVNDKEDGLQIGFTISEMAARVEAQLKSIGLVSDFAPLIYVIAHGSSSANNPHHGAHDCGACSGRPGSVNARVMATMANHPKVREVLKQNNIHIPTETQFIGALHDTAGDQMEFYDEKILSSANAASHKVNKQSFENAMDLNAKERSRRFESINTKASLQEVRKAIKDRSVSLFEPRPEYGHGTNTLCIVGGREVTKGLFLDRRAFLNSYDYRIDPEGKILTNVMRPLGPVCGGINLEYYFSRVDNHKLGAGTKLPHNVMGLFGVSNGVDGDLRPGLPSQMIEVHDPVRLMVIVEHFPEVVLNTIKSDNALYEWYINEWVHLVALHPDTKEVYYFKEGSFSKYEPLTKEIKKIADLAPIFESEKEHLPVYHIN